LATWSRTPPGGARYVEPCVASLTSAINAVTGKPITVADQIRRVSVEFALASYGTPPRSELWTFGKPHYSQRRDLRRLKFMSCRYSTGGRTSVTKSRLFSMRSGASFVLPGRTLNCVMCLRLVSSQVAV
jgi:hypothetical protein